LTEIGITRFAAKEAVIKAHPQKNLTWHGITISHQASTHADRTGAPAAIIRGTNEDYEALISISHDGDYATAVCLGAQHASQTED
jgi:holo-[acyl-carrier protein] synthase